MGGCSPVMAVLPEGTWSTSWKMSRRAMRGSIGLRLFAVGWSGRVMRNSCCVGIPISHASSRLMVLLSSILAVSGCLPMTTIARLRMSWRQVARMRDMPWSLLRLRDGALICGPFLTISRRLRDKRSRLGGPKSLLGCVQVECRAEWCWKQVLFARPGDVTIRRLLFGFAMRRLSIWMKGSAAGLFILEADRQIRGGRGMSALGREIRKAAICAVDIYDNYAL
ncbi:hypothetical protein C7453_102412 [Gluconacetobacter liquefaciens]|uniref:Uncharacterized protein n=1 Tax=Gluconacetobacter liquefaciens TaxID=89584 RepID=A0A370G732_GLULI|nr:hypothetical protein C7453_102412 [Gluconacetobacter liquefaciens]